MPSVDLRHLKKIADACRKAGIKVYECQDFKITLTDNLPPPSAYRLRKAAKSEGSKLDVKPSIQGDVPTPDMPSPTDLLFAAVGGPPPEWDA